MSTAEFLCVGRGHQVRFSEDFDELLTNTIQTTPDPLNASRELDDVALLTVLANFAGDGPYEPGETTATSSYPLLQVDEADPALRLFRWHWWLAGTALGRFTFVGRTLTRSQTIIFQTEFEPA